MKTTKTVSGNSTATSCFRFRSEEMNVSFFLLLFVIVLGTLTGCATMYPGQAVGPSELMQAGTEIPEEQLMDVGIKVFDTDELTDKKAEKEGTTAEIRKAETHFIPYHLKQAFQKSSHWGAVRVVPSETASVDLLVKGKIIASNGKNLVVEAEVVDASGKVWFRKTYKAVANSYSYTGMVRGEKDAYQDIYNTIVNDTVTYRMKLSPAEIENIRAIAKLKFAEELAPEAFIGYLSNNSKTVLKINRLPSEDDPMMARLLKIRDREYMYVDTLNEYYEVFYNAMWPSYEDWRGLNLAEQDALKKIKRDALVRQVMGALMVAGAIAMSQSDNYHSSGIETGLIIIGGQVFLDGFNISKQAEIHSSAIKELSESFESEMKPMVMEFEGKQYELTGSAEEQYKKWRQLLQDIYRAETGFGPDKPKGADDLK